MITLCFNKLTQTLSAVHSTTVVERVHDPAGAVLHYLNNITLRLKSCHRLSCMMNLKFSIPGCCNHHNLSSTSFLEIGGPYAYHVSQANKTSGWQAWLDCNL
jgi:hypothetical protein